MNKQQIGTKLALDALGIPVSLGSFDDRLTIQKAVYLAKAAGQDCGHFFRWYLRGPYSSDLTRDVFCMEAELATGEDESAEWVLPQDVVGRLGKLKQLIPASDRAARAQKLELLASVHFLVDQRQVPVGDAKAITELLHRYDKDFSESQVVKALDELRANDLLPR